MRAQRPSRIHVVLLAAIGTLAGCASSGSVALVAHRGASAGAPENTLAAFRLAWDEGADAIEADFHLTRDGQVVCIHDATTDRTTGVAGKVVEMTLAELRALDAGKGEKMPTLAEVLAVVPTGKRIFVESKVGPEIVPPLREAIAAAPLTPEQIVVISFKDEVITAAKQQLPGVKAYWLRSLAKDTPDTLEALIARARAIGADGLDVGLTAATADRVAALAPRLRAAGLELHVWTVDDPELARRAFALGARSVTTNRPGALRRGLAAPAPR